MRIENLKEKTKKRDDSDNNNNKLCVVLNQDMCSNSPITGSGCLWSNQISLNLRFKSFPRSAMHLLIHLIYFAISYKSYHIDTTEYRSTFFWPILT